MTRCRRLESKPVAARRGIASDDLLTSAWISCSSGRVPSMATVTTEPGADAPRSARNTADGLATSTMPLTLHLEDADLVGRTEAILGAAQQAVLVEALALEVEHGVDHVLEDLRAGDRAVLGDVADQKDRRARSTWRAAESAARTRAAG